MACVWYNVLLRARVVAPTRQKALLINQSGLLICCGAESFIITLHEVLEEKINDDASYTFKCFTLFFRISSAT